MNIPKTRQNKVLKKSFETTKKKKKIVQTILLIIILFKQIYYKPTHRPSNSQCTVFGVKNGKNKKVIERKVYKNASLWKDATEKRHDFDEKLQKLIEFIVNSDFTNDLPKSLFRGNSILVSNVN